MLTASQVMGEPVRVGRRFVAVELLDVIPPTEQRTANDATERRCVASKIEIEGIRIEEVARSVVPSRIDRDIGFGQRADFIDPVLPIEDVERNVASVVVAPHWRPIVAKMFRYCRMKTPSSRPRSRRWRRRTRRIHLPSRQR